MAAKPTPIGYMCKTDWQHALGYASKGNTVYPSIEDLKKNRPCWDECGIVEVEVVLRAVVVDGTI